MTLTRPSLLLLPPSPHPSLSPSSLPESLGAMSGLVELFLTDNQLASLPASMGDLKKLFKLQVGRSRRKKRECTTWWMVE